MARSATTRRTITQVSDILAQMGGLESMARELGIDKSQAAAGAAALLKKMLPILTMLVAGYMAKQGSRPAATAPTSSGDLLDGTLGRNQSSPAGRQPGGLASMLDLNGDGNPLDDILGMAGKLMR